MSEQSNAALERAHALTDVGRYAEARGDVSRHLAGEPDSPEGLCLLVLCELELGRPREALQAAERAVAAAPQSMWAAWALRLRALALHALGRSYDAECAALDAVRTDPHDWSNHHTVAQVLLERDPAVSTSESLARAYEAAWRAVELAPHEPSAHVVIGLALGRLGRPDDERRAYERALQLDPQNAMAVNNLAAMDIDKVRLGTGIKKIVSGLRLEPNERVLQQNLDIIALRTMQLLAGVTLLSLFVLLGITALGGQWQYRAGLGIILLIGYAALIWWPLRHLPSGARRHLRGLPRRMTALQRLFGAGLVVGALAVLAGAFALRPPAWLAKGTLLDLPIAYIVLATWVGQVIFFAARNRRRRREFDNTRRQHERGPQ